jgi:formylglycine-generating enzyme required for sulfatase activity
MDMTTFLGICLTLGVLTTLSSTAAQKPALPVVPGAHGFGMHTPAGSGRHLPVPETRVIKVTNLNDSGPGSLRAALAAEGPRVVVFEVSGYIDLESGLSISNPYITVAGQTAPWPGIVIRGGYTMGVSTHDVLIQHIGFRTGDSIEGRYMPHRGGIEAKQGARNIIFDHLSTGWSHQGSMRFTGSNCTARLCIISEGWYNAGHNEPRHSKGLMIGSGHHPDKRADGIAVLGNLIAHNEGRNPQSAKGTTIAMVNNVIYNFAGVGLKAIQRDVPQPAIISIEGNAFIAGCDTGGDADRPWRGKAAWIYLQNPKSSVYFSPDNILPDGKIHENPWEHINARRVMGDPDSEPHPEAVASEPSVSIPGYEVKPARKTEQWVLANVGPFPAHRNPIDARTVYETRTRTGRGRDDLADVGGWPPLEENHRELTVPENPNGDDDGDGYTNLEAWLHDFADRVEGRKGAIPEADPKLGEREAERCTKRPAVLEPDAVRKIREMHAGWTFDADEAKRRQRDAAKKVGWPVHRKVDLGDGVTIDFVLIPGGEFQMGSKYPPAVTKARGTHGVNLYRREYPPRPVRLREPFYMAQYELTQEVWEQVMGSKYSRHGDPKKPVGLLTGNRYWEKVEHAEFFAEFMTRLNETVGKGAGLSFRLPTEVEWEWACRAGTDTPFWFGEEISSDRANYNGAPWRLEPVEKPYEPRGIVPKKWGGELEPVGSYDPNPWGLYDTVGNASELVQDAWGPYPTGDLLVDPVNDRKRGTRTVRGGSCRSYPEECRSGFGTYLAVYGGRERAGIRLVAVRAERE